MVAKKHRRGWWLKIRKGRGKGATWYIVDTFKNKDEVMDQGITSLEAAKRKLKQVKKEEDYRDWV